MYCRTVVARDTWRSQFYKQRCLFQTKVTSYWCGISDAHWTDTRCLWRTVNYLIHPLHLNLLLANSLLMHYFADIFRLKIMGIRANTASTLPPYVQPRPSNPHPRNSCHSRLWWVFNYVQLNLALLILYQHGSLNNCPLDLLQSSAVYAIYHISPLSTGSFPSLH